jgi:4-amino-4-deoxy-L-arabinose transferase-like glycosyltransferase
LSRAEPRDVRRPSDPWLLALVGAGFALRAVTALLLEPGSTLLNDEATYAAGAAKLVTTGQLETGIFVRPPLYFLFVATFEFLFGVYWRLPLELAQCALGAATAWPVYAMALRLGGLRCARVAAAFWLFEPTLVAYAHLVWPETLFAWIAAWVFAGIQDAERDTAWKRARLGVLSGLAMLLKPVFGLFSAVLAFWWWRRLGFGRALRLSLVYGAAAALTIAPWVVRNQVRYGPAVVLENQGPYNLWVGNDPRPSPWILEEWAALPDPATRSRVGMERGLAAIAQDPGRFLARSAVRAVNVWGLEFFVLRNAVLGAYGDVSRASLLAAFWTLQLGWVLMLLSAAAGLPRAWRAPALRPPLLYALAVTLLVAAMVGSTRFRVPLEIPLCVAAGVGAPLLVRGRLRGRELAAVGVAAALLLVSASRPLFRTLIAARFGSVSELARDDWMRHRY